MKKFFTISILAIVFANNLYAIESCGIDQLDTGIRGTAYGQTRLDGTAGVNESNYGLTPGSGEWATEFPYGTVWGVAKCSTTTGDNSSKTWPYSSQSNWLKENPSNNQGGYCWCKATGFSPSGSNYTQGPQCTTSASNIWVFYTSYKDVATCTYACAFCGYELTTKQTFRLALLNATPRTLSLNWYDGGTTVSGGASSCTLDGTFTTPPTPAARPGYVFAGWKTITCKDKIKSLDSSTRCGSDNNRAWTKLDGTAGQNEANYGLTPGSGEWAVKFSYGTIWGQANCSTTSASIGSTTSADLRSTGGKYCLCQIRGFSASGNNYTSGPKCTIRPISTYWISANNTYDSEDQCRTYCAAICSSQMCWRQDNWRPTAFSIAGQ